MKIKGKGEEILKNTFMQDCAKDVICTEICKMILEYSNVYASSIHKHFLYKIIRSHVIHLSSASLVSCDVYGHTLSFFLIHFLSLYLSRFSFYFNTYSKAQQTLKSFDCPLMRVSLSN